jgi:hypothetical protein
MKKTIILLLALALVIAMSACGGNSTSGDAGGNTAAEQTEAPEAAEAPETTPTTYEIAGYYTVDVPSGLPTGANPENGINVSAAEPTWLMGFISSAGNTNGFDAEMKYREENDEGYMPMTVGGLSGFQTYDSTNGSVYIRFPYMDAGGIPRSSLGYIFVSDRNNADARVYLDDPLVQSMIASVRLLENPKIVFTEFDVQEIIDDRKSWEGDMMADEGVEEDGWMVFALNEIGDYSYKLDKQAVRYRVSESGFWQKGLLGPTISGFVGNVAVIMDFEYSASTQGVTKAFMLEEIENATDATFELDGLLFTFTVVGGGEYILTIEIQK